MTGSMNPTEIAGRYKKLIRNIEIMVYLTYIAMIFIPFVALYYGPSTYLQMIACSIALVSLLYALGLYFDHRAGGKSRRQSVVPALKCLVAGLVLIVIIVAASLFTASLFALAQLS